MSFLAPIIGAVAGSLLNRKSSGGTQEVNREPWEPAQDWLKQNIQTGQKLQDYYQQNPFNPIQQTGYQNLLGDLDSFRTSMAPGLFGVMGNILNNPYQAPQRPTMPPSGGWFDSGRTSAPPPGTSLAHSAPSPGGDYRSTYDNIEGMPTMTPPPGGVGGTPQPPQGESFIQALARMGTAGNKAEVYNSMRDSGMTDAEIRTRVNQAVGQQTDSDWDYLRQLAQQSRTPSGGGGGSQMPPAAPLNLFPGASYGTLDWNALNPYKSGAIPQAPTTPTAPSAPAPTTSEPQFPWQYPVWDPRYQPMPG